MRKTITFSRQTLFTNFGRKINVIIMLSLIRIDFKKANAIRSMQSACSILCFSSLDTRIESFFLQGYGRPK